MTSKNLAQIGPHFGTLLDEKPRKVGPKRLLLALLTVSKMRPQFLSSGNISELWMSSFIWAKT